MDKSQIICRCEEVTREEIIEAIKKGDLSVNAIKRRTRAGMGLCQGRTCRRLILGILATELGCNVGELDIGSHRPPIGPITLQNLSSNDEK